MIPSDPQSTGEQRRISGPGPDAPTHDRILYAAKGLFADQGFENTTTVAIARAAGTSESQLMKHFGSKEGILEAIFETGWQGLNRKIAEALEGSGPPRRKLDALVRATMGTFERDVELQSLMLLEGRRIRRGGEMVLLTEGYREFIGLLDGVLEEMREEGQLRDDLPIEGLRSALIGVFENLQRDHLLSRRTGFPADFSTAEIRDIFDAVVDAFLVA